MLVTSLILVTVPLMIVKVSSLGLQPGFHPPLQIRWISTEYALVVGVAHAQGDAVMKRQLNNK